MNIKHLKTLELERQLNKEIWDFIQPYIMSDGKRKMFYLAMGSMVLSKSLALGAPYCLKVAVNAIANAELFNYQTAMMGVMGFGI